MDRRKPRILEVTANNISGGGPRHITQLIEGLSDGFDFFLVSPPPEQANDPAPPSAVWEEMLGDRYWQEPLRKARPGPVLRLARMIRRNGIELVHSHGKGAGLFGRLAARLAGVPAVHTYHGLHYRGYSPAGRALYFGLERGLGKWTQRAICVSQSEADDTLARRLAPADRVQVVENGVEIPGNAAEGEARPEGMEDPGQFTVLTIGRIHPQKGYELLIDAADAVARRDPRIRFVVVGGAAPGDKDYEEELMKAWRSKPGLEDRLVFLGSRSDPSRWIRGADLYLSTSLWEGMPLTILEAMAGGLPVLASKVDGNRDLVVDGATGWLFEGRDPEALAEEVIRVSQLAAADLRAAGDAGRARIEERFSLRRQMDQIGEIYMSLLGKGG